MDQANLMSHLGLQQSTPGYNREHSTNTQDINFQFRSGCPDKRSEERKRSL